MAAEGFGWLQGTALIDGGGWCGGGAGCVVGLIG